MKFCRTERKNVALPGWHDSERLGKAALAVRPMSPAALCHSSRRLLAVSARSFEMPPVPIMPPRLPPCAPSALRYCTASETTAPPVHLPCVLSGFHGLGAPALEKWAPRGR
jgi:hypothetical protein